MNLRKLRQVGGLSQAGLAEKAGRLLGESMHQTTIAKIERGSRAVTIDEAEAIANALGQSAHFLTTVDFLEMDPSDEVVRMHAQKFAEQLERAGVLQETAVTAGVAAEEAGRAYQEALAEVRRMQANLDYLLDSISDEDRRATLIKELDHVERPEAP